MHVHKKCCSFLIFRLGKCTYTTKNASFSVDQTYAKMEEACRGQAHAHNKKNLIIIIIIYTIFIYNFIIQH